LKLRRSNLDLFLLTFVNEEDQRGHGGTIYILQFLFLQSSRLLIYFFSRCLDKSRAVLPMQPQLNIFTELRKNEHVRSDYFWFIE